MIEMRASAQDAPLFSGYILDLPLYEFEPTGSAGNIVANLTRLRLRAGDALWSGARFGIEYEVAALAHTGTLPVPTLGRSPQGMFPFETATLVSNNHFVASHFIDRLYVRQALGPFDATIGRQRIAWGTGRVWNPTDLFSPINPARFDKIEKDGVDAALLRYTAGDFTDATMVLAKDRFAARVRTNVKPFDFSAMAGDEGKTFVGADFAGNLGGVGVRGEALVSFEHYDIPSTRFRWILGADNQFSSSLYGFVEFQRQPVYASSLAPLMVERNELAIGGSYLINPVWTASATSITNLNDGSGFLSALLSYSAADNLTLIAGAFAAFGDGGSQYGGYARAGYVEGQWFF